MAASRTRAFLRSELHRLAFTPASELPDHRLIGAEVEVLVVDAATGRPSPICHANPESGAREGTLAWLQPLAERERWVGARTAKGAPCFRLADGSVIGFEPGGQLEYSSAPQRSASVLLRRIATVLDALHDAASDAGVALLHVGIDPVNPIERVPLQLDQPRYTRMDAYLASRGPSGRRMMRQTAATQVAVDLGPPAKMLDRWRLLNAAVPVVIAAFANSPRYAGRDTGDRSHRCHIWRTLDASRTGIVGTGGDPVGEYLGFALRAPAMFHGDSGSPDAFGELARRDLVNAHDWEDHLSSLFPEVRPRGYFEVRSADAVPPAWLPALVGTIGGIVYDASASAAALDLLGLPATDEALARAGRVGLRDPVIARRAHDLMTIGLEGCTRLGATFMEPDHLEEMRGVIADRIARGMAPCDETRDAGARGAGYLRWSSTTAAAMSTPPAIVDAVSG